MRRAWLLVASSAAAAAILIGVSLPPLGRALATAPEFPPSVRGAIHIHTRRSDGTGTPRDIASAAARAGLQFVILTDHDTAASEPTRPYYEHGVLIIEGVEVSADGGHIVALGLPRAPYPLGGETRDVIEDVERLGGLSIAAHPGSPKAGLRWLDWTAPFDGLEWVNGDSEWRDEGAGALLKTLATYPFRRPETLASLLDRPDEVLRRWDVLTSRRRVVAVAATDAHARIGLRSGEPDDKMLGVHLPGYEAMFRTLSITLSPLAFTGNAAADAGAVIAAIGAGHVYSSIDGLAAPARMTFSARTGAATAIAGDALDVGPRDIVLEVRSNAPPEATIVLLKDGVPQATKTGAALTQTVSGARAVYRVEIQLPGAPGEPPVPWVLSNPIYVGVRDGIPVRGRPTATEIAVQYEDGEAAGWTVEMSPRSKAIFDVLPPTGDTQLSLRWGLGGAASESPYVALVMPAGPALGRHDRLMFTARADQPTRVSVQLRVPTAGDGERWHRSVYLDDTPRDVTIFFDEMTPRGFTQARRPVLADVRDVLFVIDTVNARPGAAGQIWIDDVKYGR